MARVSRYTSPGREGHGPQFVHTATGRSVSADVGSSDVFRWCEAPEPTTTESGETDGWRAGVLEITRKS
jgi:hypothetical protein